MASLDKVAIANRALLNIGVTDTIESFTEDSTEAEAIEAIYEHARRVTLAAYDWSFARARATLTQHATAAPTTDWAYRYEYPTEALVIRRLVNPLGPTAEATPFEIEVVTSAEQRTILTDLEDAEAVYTANISNVELFSEHFAEALAAQIAVMIAYGITKKRSVRADAVSAYAELIRIAPTHDSNESIQRKPREAEWITAREA